MICIKPYFTGTAAYGCGQCMPCRLNRRRLWSHRIMMEAQCHAQNAFVTLTYSDENLPADKSVDPRALQLFLKRLRFRISPRTIRYFAVGEYGDDNERPHYHLALFNFQPCSGAIYTARKLGEPCPCQSCSDVREAWSFGHVLIGTLTHASASYLGGYITKKMTAIDDVRLNGRKPEFSRMSLRPHGIGVDALWDAASVMMQYKLGVPTGLRHGSKVLPLGRYLRRKLSEFSSTPIDNKFVDERLQLVRSYAFAHSLSVSKTWRSFAEPAAEKLAHSLKQKERRKL